MSKVAKVFERAAFNQIYEYIEPCMSNLLTRFLKNRNVEYSLLKTPEIWKEAFYKGLLLLLIVKLKADLYKFSYINSKLVRPTF